MPDVPGPPHRMHQVSGMSLKGLGSGLLALPTLQRESHCTGGAIGFSVDSGMPGHNTVNRRRFSKPQDCHDFATHLFETICAGRTVARLLIALFGHKRLQP